MSDLDSLTAMPNEIRRWFEVTRDDTGTLPALSGILPDQRAPVVRQGPLVAN